MNLYHEMLENRRIIISDIITSESVEKLIALIQAMVLKNQEPAELCINSDGGSTEATLRLYDVMRNSGIKFHGVVVGKCMSAALILLQACDERVAYSHSSFLLHHPKRKYTKVFDPTRVSLKELYKDIKVAWEQALNLGKISEQVLCSRLKNRRWYNRFYKSDEDMHFGALDALQMGLIDKIID